LAFGARRRTKAPGIDFSVACGCGALSLVPPLVPRACRTQRAASLPAVAFTTAVALLLEQDSGLDGT
jgi:hypothetical protein